MNILYRLCWLYALLLSPLLCAQVHVTADQGRAVSEWWYEPESPGWGLILTHSGNRTVMLYAGFDGQGRDVWQVGVGSRSVSAISVELMQSHWDAGTNRVDQQWVAGAVDFRYVGLDRAEATIRQGDSVRTVALARIVSTRQSAVDDYSGLWHNPEVPGFGMALLTQGPVLAVLASAYDGAGAPRWWLGYKLSRPNDPAPFVAKRFRRDCALATCSVTEVLAGSISIRPRNERDLSAHLRLNDGFSPLPNAPVFANFGRYQNIGESASGRVDPSDARPFHSDAALDDYLTLAETASPELPYGCIDFSPAPAGTTVGAAGSGTNTQEVGIDEGDIVARSGDLVVSRSHYTLFSDPPISVSRFNLTRIRSDMPVASHIADLFLPVLHHAESAVVLPAPAGRHRFALLSSNRQTGFGFCAPTLQEWPPETALTVIEVDALGQVSQLWRYIVAARAGALRLQDNALLLTTSASVLTGVNPDGTSWQTFRPTWHFEGGAAAPLLRAENTWLSDFQPGTLGTTVVTVHRLPLAQPDLVKHFSLFSSQGNLYVGPDSVYLSSVRVEPISFTEDNQVMSYRTLTGIHQLDAQDLSWRGSADVAGQLVGDYAGTWAMQERHGTLRVLTNHFQSNSVELLTAAKLTVLAPSATERRLLVTAELPNAARPQPIGRSGEEIRGVRFFGDRLNVVSFRRIDPLYAIDLSDPTDPKIADELEITGYSEYLHQLPSGKLLGFGVEVDPNGSNAWQPEALKLSLFEGNDGGSSLAPIQSFLFGGAYSQLPVLNEPHAVSVFQSSPEDLWFTAPTRLSLPAPPGTYGPMAVLRVRYNLAAGRILEARVIPTSAESNGFDNIYDARTVVFGSQLYYFHEDQVYAAPLASPIEVLPQVL
ncbi:beta-propeller domain-containing protein [Ahniella affigens]|uniref:beta-propeller domain-containing protein n=1 Tax=Ahniella affigens TaxID=2021234 RepID=UPI00147394FD|nr:beta-propeller domain-containing protein [Ahniella affigens]